MMEFGIAEAPVYKNEQWHLVGRCVTDIHVGGRFTKFVPHRRIGVPSIENMNFVTDEALPIDLTILEIHAYGKNLKEWSAGLTALLVLVGDGENLQSNGHLVSE